MPFAVALLCHPAGAYVCVVTTIAAFVYGCHTRAFVPAFTAAAAAMLTALAFLHARPDEYGLLLIAMGVLLLQLELFAATYGAAFVLGFASTIWGSWRLLAGVSGAPAALATSLRLAIACAGALALLAAVLRAVRLRTLRARLPR